MECSFYPVHKQANVHTWPQLVAQWVRRCPVHQKFAGLIPGESTCPGCRLHPRQRLCRRQPIAVFVSASLPFLFKKQ